MPTKKLKPSHLSIVIVARNDDYGAHFLHRLTSSLSVWLHLLSKAKHNYEFIIVEYNPPSDKATLDKVIQLSPPNNVNLIFIRVPNSFHRKLPNSNKMPMFEYIAKNIGVFRAKSDYILVTNPDIVPDEALISFLDKSDLNSDSVYRKTRFDLANSTFNNNNPVEILKQAKRSVRYVTGNVRCQYVRYSDWIKDLGRRPWKDMFHLFPAFNRVLPYENTNSIHDKAAGDFLLMSKQLWQKVGGYDQSPLSSFFDGYIMGIALYCFKAKQVLIPGRIYHIAHQIGKSDRPEYSYQKYRTDMLNMKRTGKPYIRIINNPGFPEEYFKKIVVSIK